MKFVHIADMHFDIPFTVLSKNGLGDARRLDQKIAFKQIIEYIKENKIDYLFICGDLYEHEYVKQNTIEYINHLFEEIPQTKIYIVPGNHDPLVKDSYYAKFKFSKNVTIFNENIQIFSEEKVDIYGFGFNNFYKQNSEIENIEIKNPNKINILLTHGNLDASDKEEMQYNPLSKSKLKALGFDYIGLGHIHKPYYKDEKKQNIIYPGSVISLGFDEQGNHGMIVGEITEDKKLKLAFVCVDKKEFIEEELDISNFYTQEEIIEELNKKTIDENKYYEIILVGKRSFEINKYEIQKQMKSNNIIKIKDNTELKVDLEELAKENSLKGIFIKNMLNKINETNKEDILKAIEIGLQAM